MSSRQKLTFVFIILAAATLWQLGLAGWIHTKAIAAQILLDRAWQQTLVDHKQTRPCLLYTSDAADEYQRV